jgi:glutathione S-transferase
MLELYHYEPYANSMKCLLCLTEKGLDFVSRYVDILKFEQHSPEFIALNSSGQVPVLVHDGTAISESTVINEYLDDVFPALPLRPADPVARAEMRIWSKFVDEVLMPSVSAIGWHLRFHPFVNKIEMSEFKERLKHIPMKEMQEKWLKTHEDSFTEHELNEAKRKIRWAVEKTEQMLAESAWLVGSGYSLADINTYPMIEGAARLHPEGCNKTVAPRTMEWLHRISARPMVQVAFSYSRFGNVPGRAADAEAKR